METATIEELKRNCPKEFAVFCEKTGRLEEAVEFYASSHQAVDVLHAVDIAIQMNNYELAKTLLTITEELSEEDLRETKEYAENARSGLSAAMAMGCAQRHYDYLKKEVSLKKIEIEKLAERA